LCETLQYQRRNLTQTFHAYATPRRLHVKTFCLNSDITKRHQIVSIFVRLISAQQFSRSRRCCNFASHSLDRAIFLSVA